jgi:alpha-L-fucosidase
MVIRMLVECVSKNGNLLLNVGPDARGRIPPGSVNVLEAVGRWMDNNGESIYGCGATDGCGAARIDKPEWGRFTRRGNTLYAHVLESRAGGIYLPNLAGQVEKLRLLADGSEIKIADHWNVKEYAQHSFFFLNGATADSYPLPDPADTVVAVTLKE